LKNKWLAGILNILPGVGYLYVGVRTPFAVILLLILPAIIIGGTLDPALNSSADTNSSMSWGVALFFGVPIVAFVVDAYLAAKEHNGRIKN